MIEAISSTEFSFDPLSLAMGGAAGFLAALFLMLIWVFALAQKKARLEARLDAERAALEDHFKSLAQDTLKSNAESFLTLAQEKLKNAQDNAAHDLEKRSQAIAQMVNPVQKHLEQLGGAVKELHGTKQMILNDLQNLNKETSKLAGALRNPAARGNWGEEMLERLLEGSGLIKDINYFLQTHIEGESGRKFRPDAIVRLPDKFHIVIDSKAPINDFIRKLDEDLEESDYKNLQTDLARAVRHHIGDLGKKSYWENLDSPDFVVLFLPSEHLFSAAVQADPSLLDYAAEKKVVMASPTIMMSLLRVVSLSWRQVELAKNAQEIARQGGALHDKITGFVEDMLMIGKRLDGADSAYRAAMNKLSEGRGNILTRAASLKEMGVQTTKSLPADLVEYADKDVKKVAND